MAQVMHICSVIKNKLHFDKRVNLMTRQKCAFSQKKRKKKSISKQRKLYLAEIKLSQF